MFGGGLCNPKLEGGQRGVKDEEISGLSYRNVSPEDDDEGPHVRLFVVTDLADTREREGRGEKKARGGGGG